MMRATNDASAAGQASLNGLVDRMLRRLNAYGHLDGFSDDEVVRVLEAAHRLLQPLPVLIELKAPIVVFGDLHGQ